MRSWRFVEPEFLQLLRDQTMATGDSSSVGRSNWQTSDTFLGDIYSGDPQRLSDAFKRFVEGRLPTILNQIRNALPAHHQNDVEDVGQIVLLELHKDIVTKGWRHPPGVRFRQCVGQLAKDAISGARRKISRKREVEMSDSMLEPTCETLVSGFWRTEVLHAAETRVQSVTPAAQWQIYLSWKIREGMSWDVDGKEFVGNGDSARSDNERQILSRVRKAIRGEIERIAERGGFEPRELLEEHL